jgi:hypothetical protein
MSYTTLDEAQIKELFKQAFVELLQERRDLFYELLAEVVEDSGLLNAIREGEGTATVDRDEVFHVLEGAS